MDHNDDLLVTLSWYTTEIAIGVLVLVLIVGFALLIRSNNRKGGTSTRAGTPPPPPFTPNQPPPSYSAPFTPSPSPSAASQIVACANCGQRNRVPHGARTKCGTCGAAMDAWASPSSTEAHSYSASVPGNADVVAQVEQLERKAQFKLLGAVITLIAAIALGIYSLTAERYSSLGISVFGVGMTVYLFYQAGGFARSAEELKAHHGIR